MLSQTKRAKRLRKMRRTETKRAKTLRNRVRYASVRLYAIKDVRGEHAERMRRYYRTYRALAKDEYATLTRKEKGLC